jgi:hypothetical protein
MVCFYGEKNPNSKLTWDDIELIMQLRDHRVSRINEIKEEKKKLEAERKKLIKETSRAQLAVKFEVTERAIQNIFSGDSWGSK